MKIYNSDSEYFAEQAQKRQRISRSVTKVLGFLAFLALSTLYVTTVYSAFGIDLWK